VNRRIAYGILILATAAGALAFRLSRLTDRPMHCDEAVHAYKFGDLLERDYYRYDPNEYHGPTLNYLTLPIAAIRGQKTHAELDEVTLRLVPAVVGVASVLLLLLIGDGLGYPAAVCAAVLTAVSTAMVFYSRYYIQEMLLVCFTFAAMVGLWRFVRSGHAGWCILAGAGVGLMHATKETWVFVPAAAAVAMLINIALSRRVYNEPLKLRPHVLNWRIGAGFAVAAGVSVVFLSSFFTNWAGPWDSIATYVAGLRRAGGSTGQGGNLHLNPWHFYLRILGYTRYGGRGPIWSEGLILGLAAVGAVAGLIRRGLGRADAKLVRFLAFYSVVLFAIYTVIPYKTPWCILGSLHGLILLAGVGAVAIVRWARWLPLRILAALLLTGGAAQLGWQARRATGRFDCDPRNPYVYGHSLRGVVRLGARAEQMAEVSPDGHAMRINVITPDAHDVWPLPWYLRRFDESRIGYHSSVPAEPDAAMVIFTGDVWEALEPKLEHKYQIESKGLRPSVVLWVAIREDLWKRHMEKVRAELQARKAGKEKAMTDQPATSPADEVKVHRFTHSAMACVFEARIASADRQYAFQAAREAFEEVDRVEKQLSRFEIYGDVGRINATPPNEPVRIGLEATDCLVLAQKVWADTLGAFDVTARAPAGPEAGDGPPVTMAMLAVNEQDHLAARTDERVRVDLGGIGKGYALDCMAESLREWEIESALLHCGASTALAMSPPPGKAAWRLSLRDPSNEQGDPIARVRLKDCAFSGSATVHAKHIVDPRTGKPVPGDRAAWAVAGSAALADALSTALCVMDLDEVRGYAAKHPDVTCMVAVRDEGRWRLETFGPDVRVKEGPN